MYCSVCITVPEEMTRCSVGGSRVFQLFIYVFIFTGGCDVQRQREDNFPRGLQQMAKSESVRLPYFTF